MKGGNFLILPSKDVYIFSSFPLIREHLLSTYYWQLLEYALGMQQKAKLDIIYALKYHKVWWGR